ncbi:MAG: DUF1269 domain-containing protein [Deltaproteobacteria bacterium]|nr:DUF1269 domain-containing protein [Deltaproteobacteria bacterium]
MALKLGVVIFSGAERAQEILTQFQETHLGDPWIEHIGMIERRKSGKIAVYGVLGADGYWAEEGSTPLLGTALGALTGLLVGAVAGPAGIGAGGALGAAVGGLLGTTDEEEADHTIFDIIRAKLLKNSSALVLLAEDTYVDELVVSTRAEAVDIYQSVVREELRGRLEEALREAAAKEDSGSRSQSPHPPAL